MNGIADRNGYCRECRHHRRLHIMGEGCWAKDCACVWWCFVQSVGVFDLAKREGKDG